ncbi:hypothetical protein [Epilithonimonas sp.]|uniref:hypothetical protein n=1 Tax=Epilithonimonas sp. TaxID=2894511 RepID=UPI0035B1BED0
MKISRLFFIFVFLATRIFAQSDYILGNVANESGDKLPFASVHNLRTDQIVMSDKMGNFAIAAKSSDELRITRQGYERKVISITPDSFSKSLNVNLTSIPEEIEEVKLSFRPTGILKKDVTRLNPPPKVVALNAAMNLYMRTPPNEVAPKASIPSAFRQPDFSAGQLNVLGLAKAINGLLGKATSAPKTTADYAEAQAFYKRVKSVIDLGYYTKYGLDEYDFDVFLAYADRAYDLAKNYRNNFNKAVIEFKLKEAFAEYIKTHNFSRKQSEG